MDTGLTWCMLYDTHS